MVQIEQKQMWKDKENWSVDSLRRTLNYVYEITYNQLNFFFSNYIRDATLKYLEIHFLRHDDKK